MKISYRELNGELVTREHRVGSGITGVRIEKVELTPDDATGETLDYLKRAIFLRMGYPPPQETNCCKCRCSCSNTSPS